MSHFNVTQQAYIDQDNRNMAANAIAMSQVLNDLYDLIAAGSIGITAIAAAVDAVCLANDHFTRDKVTGPGSSLVFAWFTSHFWNGKQRVTVAAGNLVLAASQTNYIEVDANGTVSSNTAAFSTDGSKYPLWIVVTAAAAYTDNNVTNVRCTETFVPAGSFTGSLASTPMKTKELPLQLGTISATTATPFRIETPNTANVTVRISLIVDTTIAQSDADYWAFEVQNKGAGGVSATKVVDGTLAVNTTKVSGGSGITNNVPRVFTLTANINNNAGEVLTFVATKNGAAANLVGASLKVDVTVNG